MVNDTPVVKADKMSDEERQALQLQNLEGSCKPHPIILFRELTQRSNLRIKITRTIEGQLQEQSTEEDTAGTESEEEETKPTTTAPRQVSATATYGSNILNISNVTIEGKHVSHIDTYIVDLMLQKVYPKFHKLSPVVAAFVQGTKVKNAESKIEWSKNAEWAEEKAALLEKMSERQDALEEKIFKKIDEDEEVADEDKQAEKERFLERQKNARTIDDSGTNSYRDIYAYCALPYWRTLFTIVRNKWNYSMRATVLRVENGKESVHKEEHWVSRKSNPSMKSKFFEEEQKNVYYKVSLKLFRRPTKEEKEEAGDEEIDQLDNKFILVTEESKLNRNCTSVRKAYAFTAMNLLKKAIKANLISTYVKLGKLNDLSSLNTARKRSPKKNLKRKGGKSPNVSALKKKIDEAVIQNTPFVMEDIGYKIQDQTFPM